MSLEKWQINGVLRRTGVVLFLAILVTLAMWPLNHAIAEEKTYESSAVLNLAVPEEIQDEQLREEYFRKEEALMVSDEVLRPVVEGLNLTEEWSLSPAQAVMILRGKTEVERLELRGGRRRFSITARAADAELARSLATGVAMEYQSQGNAKARREWEKKLEALDEEIQVQKELVEQKRLLLERVRSESEEAAVEGSENAQG